MVSEMLGTEALKVARDARTGVGVRGRRKFGGDIGAILERFTALALASDTQAPWFWRSAMREESQNSSRRLTAELVGLRVDAIYLASDPAILAAKQATTTIPIVMVACDAVAAGLLASPASGSSLHPCGDPPTVVVLDLAL
jgi:hypothetical protein